MTFFIVKCVQAKGFGKAAGDAVALGCLLAADGVTHEKDVAAWASVIISTTCGIAEGMAGG
ncbi:hypothetical protein [Streptomyces sp. NPDC056549]|uniref:hypothetical protein n=1 Tax=Streptomyces sp. NPDC056549 TaxID=3345864 RepID=UPI0036B123A2